MSGPTSSRSRVGGIAGRTTRVSAVSPSGRSRQSSKDEQNSAWIAAWTTALDELEMDVAQAESLLTPPTPVPVIPGIPGQSALPLPGQPALGSGNAPTYGRDARFSRSVQQTPPPSTPIDFPVGAMTTGPGMPGTPAMPDSSVWEPPTLPGPLPEELKSRAASLLDRQLAVAESLTKAMLGNRGQAGLLEKMERSGGDEPRSAYVDRAC